MEEHKHTDIDVFILVTGQSVEQTKQNNSIYKSRIIGTGTKCSGCGRVVIDNEEDY